MNKTSILDFFKGVVAAVLAVATISACSKADSPRSETIDSAISVEGGTLIKTDAAAATLEVKLSLSGPGAAETVVVTSSASWLKKTIAPAEDGSEGSGSLLDDLFKSGSEGSAEDEGGDAAEAADEAGARSVWLALEENASSGSRAATVTLSLKGAKDVRLTIIQNANPDYVVNSQVTFTLDVNDIAESSVQFTVAPSISDCYYAYAFVPESTFIRYDNAREYVDSAVVQMKAYAAAYEEKYGTPFSLKSQLYKGYISTTASSLKPDTQYYLIAFDITLNYSYSGNSAVYKFKTAAVPPSSDEFTIVYNQENGTVIFTPSENLSGSYGFGICPAETWENAKSPSVVVDGYLDSEYFTAYSVSEGAKGYPLYYNSAIVAGEEYVAFAFSYNSSTGKASNIAWLRFTYNN